MCGIVGYYSWGRPEENGDRLRDALYQLRHRGPDDEGITLIDTRKNQRADQATDSTIEGVRLHYPHRNDHAFAHTLGLGHRRFALVDPGPQSHQPFWSRDGRLCVAWNGEIYNHVELRAELEAHGHRFSTSSDTEVLIEGYRAWGTECFKRFIGFWAVSLFDAERPGVLLARDRLGKAPLYVTSSDHGLSWASELGALRILDHTRSWTVREQSVVDFLHWNMRDMDGTTFFNEVTTFPAASFAWVRDGEFRADAYWQLPRARLTPTEITVSEAAVELRRTLDDAVRVRLRADVPIGVQVSGGLDSSSILALAAGQSDRLDAYTVSFPQPEANEEPFARAVAERHRETVDYHVLSPPTEDHMTRLVDFVRLMGEPFHSPNQITNHAIWETIRGQGLRGVLYGAGGDEVLAGYPSEYGHPYLRWLTRRGKLVRAAREFIAFPATYHSNVAKDWAIKALLTSSSRIEDRIRMAPVPREIDPFTIPQQDRRPTPAPSEFEARLNANLTQRLIPYWTRIDNQNSMSVPIELRCPFLDHRVVELGFRLPAEYLIHHGWTKWILRVALQHDLPDEVTWRRRKMGFPFPLDVWLTENKDRLLAILAERPSRFVDLGVLSRNFEQIIELNQIYLWHLLCLGMWRESHV